MAGLAHAAPGVPKGVSNQCAIVGLESSPEPIRSGRLGRNIVNRVRIRVGSQPRESFRKTPLSRDLEGVIIADARCISISRIHDVGKYVSQRTARLRSSGARIRSIDVEIRIDLPR